MGAVGTIYNNNTASQLIAQYQGYAQDYLNNNNGATVASQSEYALMKIFGSAINFFKKDPSTGKYEPYKVDANGNIQKIVCP